MKKIIIRTTVFMALATLLLAPLSAQTAADILAKMIEAQGGRKALEAVVDWTSSGTFELVQFGMQGSIVMYQKEPNLMRMDMDIQGFQMTQAFDGQNGWAINPQTGAAESMSELQNADMKRQSLGNAALLAPETLGISYELQGRETLNGKEHWVLVQKFNDGHSSTLCVDPETHLPYKSKSKGHDMMGAEVESETIMTDYRIIDGFPVAHSMIIFQNGAEFIRISLTSVKLNGGLDESLFKMNR